MSNEDVLEKDLARKNKEIEFLKERNEKIKQDFDAEKKNLMNSIKTLKKNMDKIEQESHSDKRVEIINKLREERKYQEQTILLLRKYILKNSNEAEKEKQNINKYLIDFYEKKYGEQRYISYEELKIKYEELENKYMKLKKSKGVPLSTRNNINQKEMSKKIPESELDLLVVKRFKAQLDEYDFKIKNLENENNNLKSL